MSRQLLADADECVRAVTNFLCAGGGGGLSQPANMAMSSRAPKQWCLTKCETVDSFENWRQNIQYLLSLDSKFTPYLASAVRWGNKTSSSPLRGFTNDGSDAPEDQSLTAQQKVYALELMLGQLANYCPVISQNTIVKNLTCMSDIWQAIQLHYGFQSTGAHFLDLADIKLEHDKKPEDLYQRINAFVDDNLLQ